MQLGLGAWAEIQDQTFDFFRQLGVDNLVLHLPDLPVGDHWEFRDLLLWRTRIEAAGLKLAAIENFNTCFYDKIMLGRPGRDEQIENIRTTIRNLGRAGIRIMGYHFMLNSVWRTEYSPRGRGGAKVTIYDHDLVKDAPVSAIGEFDDEAVWANLTYFLKAIIPVAEEEGVVMALHPDDPPVPKIAGVARIIRSIEAYKRVIEIVPSPSNCLEFCQGTVAEMCSSAEQVYDAIRYFGSRKKIAYVHFRNVSRCVPKFEETFIDEGFVDMLQAMRVYKEVGFDGVLIVDHWPALTGDTPFGHGGQAYALGYMKALLKCVNSCC